MDTEKVTWSGRVTSVQPRIRLLRSFDERSHSYVGYVLRLDGQAGGEDREFSVAIGKAAHEKHQFRVGDQVGGKSHPVYKAAGHEIAEFYKTSGIKVSSPRPEPDSSGPPWQGVAPQFPVYRERRHRRLAAKTYESKCTTCIWGCSMPVEITIDHWNPRNVRHRTETFCYGPLSCPVYKAGPTRKVTGRRGMTYEEPDEVDAEETAHRGPDD